MRYHLFNETLNDSNRNFIISGEPSNIDNYINILNKNSINLVINLTDINYDLSKENKLKNVNIDYLHFPLIDGHCLSDDKIKNLLNFLNRYNSIAFHCVAGLGRAPLVLGVCLILLYNYKPLDVIEKIRKKESKALNTIQINYLMNFKRKKYISDNNCIIC
jgi:protein tyrosine phosphatase type 4A